MALIWNGVPIPCEAHVIDWRSSGLQFKVGENGCYTRRKLPVLFLIHFTGAENPPPVTFANLRKAPARSVEFGMDFYGQIWQFADPAKIFCAHAEGANKFSFGIEIQNRGVPTSNGVINRKFPRGVYSEDMPWGKQSYTCFTADQLTELEKLIAALAAAKIIPGRLAMAKSAIRKRCKKSTWAGLGGVAGHYHCDVEPGKIDPGPQVFDELWSHFNE